MLLLCAHMQAEPSESTTAAPTTTSINNSSSSSSDSNSSGSTIELKPQHGYRAEGKSSNVFQRYCHLYKQGELEQLCEEIAGCAVVQSYYDSSNWCVMLQKTAVS
jgi:hypothetical protein